MKIYENRVKIVVFFIDKESSFVSYSHAGIIINHGCAFASRIIYCFHECTCAFASRIASIFIFNVWFGFRKTLATLVQVHMLGHLHTCCCAFFPASHFRNVRSRSQRLSRSTPERTNAASCATFGGSRISDQDDQPLVSVHRRQYSGLWRHRQGFKSYYHVFWIAGKEDM